MSKKRDARIMIDDAYAATCLAYVQLKEETVCPDATAALNSALFNLSIARLWLTCPEQMADAKTIGRPTARLHAAELPPAAPPASSVSPFKSKTA